MLCEAKGSQFLLAYAEYSLMYISTLLIPSIQQQNHGTVTNCLSIFLKKYCIYLLINELDSDIV